VGTVPTNPTFVAGATLPAAYLTQLASVSSFALTPPQCYAYQATLQSLTNNTYGVISMDAEVFEVANSYDGGSDSPHHDNTTDNSRVYVRTSGKYEIVGQVQIASNATGVRIAQVRSNAAGNVASGTQLAVNQQGALTGASTSVTIPTVIAQLNAGDYLEIFALQNSGGALNTVPGLGVTFLRIRLVGS